MEAENQKRECGNCNWWEKGAGWEDGTCRDALRRAKRAIPESVLIRENVRVVKMASWAGLSCSCWERKHK